MNIKKAPIIFTPYLKPVIWGGKRLCAYKDIEQQGSNIGESWEISAVDGHVSTVESGEYAGMTLTELIDRFGAELLGEKVIERYGYNFPLLIKFIDANDKLSVQVHPGDELASRRHGCSGKTELWYIIESNDDAEIYSGLNRVITPEEYDEMVARGTFGEVIATHSAKPGDVFFLPAGRVHAIGGGNLLAEIQQSSDITYRIYDYDRRDAMGKTRELHTDLAREAIDYTVHPDYKSPTPPESKSDVQIAECEHFRVRRIKVDGETRLTFDAGSFTVVMCIDGALEINGLKLRKGHTVLLPAVITEATISGKATLLITQA